MNPNLQTQRRIKASTKGQYEQILFECQRAPFGRSALPTADITMLRNLELLEMKSALDYS